MNALIHASDIVGELCIALAYRWEPKRLFVILTAYLDESGTHGDSPVTIMGGVMANARQWSKFDLEFTAAKKKHGFKIFHTKKFKAKRGDFAGWSNEQCLALIYDLANITSHTFREGVVMALDNVTYERDYKAGPKPRRLRLDSKYGLCFRECLLHFIREALKREYRKELPKLHIVLESGDPNTGDAKRIFNDLSKELESVGCEVLGKISIAHKDKCDPLMMADFIAHTTYSMELKEKGEPPPIPAKDTRRRKAGITHLKYKPGAVAKMKQEIIAKFRRS